MLGLESWVALMRGGLLNAWIFARTWGMHPSHPDHGKYALLRARMNGGVHVR